jgi:uncharacterized protein YndB with AHSA1/START domain
MSEASTVEEREIRIVRVFDAPRELVFQAWTDADHVAKWFGPAGFEVPRESVEIDARAGGLFTLRMVHAESRREFPLRYEIVELVAPELIVLKSEPMPAMGLAHPTFTRIELADEAGKTRMLLIDGPFSPEGGQGASHGWEAAFDKLDGLLAT